MEQSFKVIVNESFEFDIQQSDLERLDFVKLSSSKLHLINNNKSLKIDIENSDFNSKKYIIRVNSNNYTVKISNPLDLLIKEMGFSVSSNKILNEIKAPMPGLILQVNVEIGNKVKEGEVILILEAMKMENAICAPRDGIIKSINIKKGKAVEKGALLIEMV